MKAAVFTVAVAITCCHVGAFAQDKSIALTARITSLDGLWQLDATKGVAGNCGNTIDQTIRIGVSAQGVSFESRRLAGLDRLDGTSMTTTGLGNFNGIVSAALDGGWLAVTTRRIRTAGASSGSTNLQHDVYIVRDDELTIWRTFNVELPDGTQNPNVCGNRQAIVYQRQRQP